MSSGYGDGAYPVYIKKNEDGRVVELKVVFDSGAVWRKEAYDLRLGTMNVGNMIVGLADVTLEQASGTD